MQISMLCNYSDSSNLSVAIALFEMQFKKKWQLTETVEVKIRSIKKKKNNSSVLLPGFWTKGFRMEEERTLWLFLWVTPPQWKKCVLR